VSLYAATFLDNNKKWEKNIKELMDARYKQTLGKLIRDAEKELQIPDEISEELEQALTQRNWVTHHFFREYGAVGQSPALMREATKRLESTWPLFEEVASKINQLVFQRMILSGKTEKEIHAGIQIAIDTYVQENT